MKITHFEQAVANAKVLAKRGYALHISVEPFRFTDEIETQSYSTYYPTEIPGVYKIVSKSSDYRSDIENYVALTKEKYKNMSIEEFELYRNRAEHS